MLKFASDKILILFYVIKKISIFLKIRVNFVDKILSM